MTKKFKNSAPRDLSAPSYIKTFENANSMTQVAARIPADVKLRFDNAQEILRRHGLDMQLNDVIRDALCAASEYVSREYGEPDSMKASVPVTSNESGKGSALSEKTSAHSFTASVEDSSPGGVEEWGASGSVDGSSTDSGASPLTGSTAPSQAQSGVVSASKGGRNGTR